MFLIVFPIKKKNNYFSSGEIVRAMYSRIFVDFTKRKIPRLVLLPRANATVGAHRSDRLFRNKTIPTVRRAWYVKAVFKSGKTPSRYILYGKKTHTHPSSWIINYECKLHASWLISHNHNNYCATAEAYTRARVSNINIIVLRSERFLPPPSTPTPVHVIWPSWRLWIVNHHKTPNRELVPARRRCDNRTEPTFCETPTMDFSRRGRSRRYWYKHVVIEIRACVYGRRGETATVRRHKASYYTLGFCYVRVSSQ